jgi:hypothetical protein
VRGDRSCRRACRVVCSQRLLGGPQPGRACSATGRDRHGSQNGRSRLLTPLIVCVSLCCASLAPASALALSNPERHYEMVTPPYKGGYGVLSIKAVAVAGAGEGERVQFNSLGTFAGAPNDTLLSTYVAVRSAGGWSTMPLMLPATPSMPRGNESSREVVSSSLESVLFVGALANHSGEVQEGAEEGFYEKEYLFQPLSVPQTSPQVVYGPLTKFGGGSVGDIAPHGASPDLCHMLFNSTGGPLLPEDKGPSQTLYELSAGNSVNGCGGEAPSLRLLAVETGPKGEQQMIDPYCEPLLGGGEASGRGNMNLNVVSADGTEVFFTADTNLGEAKCDGQNGYFPQGPARLFVRLNGERTVQISQPLAVDCAVSAPCHSAAPQRAVFTGAGEQGMHVFFTTIQPLVTGDSEFTCRKTAGQVHGIVEGLGEFETQAGCESPNGGSQKERATWKRFGNDVYMATLECLGGGEGCPAGEREVTSLVQVSRSTASGEPAEVQGEQAVTVSADGGRVYFVARGVLSEGANREQRVPLKGADNLYVYDVAENRNHFVADLCTGREQSGAVLDPACPGGSDSEQWLGVREAETTRNGQFLVFTSYAQLSPDDTDTRKDIYRYDAATETLERVSLGEGGYDSNGNNNNYDVELPNMDPGRLPVGRYYMQARAISEDGSRIVFGTAEPLSSQALNGLSNVYEWHEGHMSLISSGVGPEAEGEVTPAGGDSPVITPSGRDVFLISAQGLVPQQDTDGVRDVYDARLGEGFPLEPAPPRSCDADACQGPLMNPAPLLVPGSVSQAPGENVPAPPPAKSKTTKKTKVKAKRGKHRATRRSAGRSRRVAGKANTSRRGR